MSVSTRLLVVAVLLGLAGCGVTAPSSSPTPSGSPVTATCPDSAGAALRGTTSDVPVPGVPTGALVCSVNIAAKRTPTVAMSQAQAAALARLLDAGSPAAAAARCRDPLGVTLVRFAGPSGATDVTTSGRCRSVLYAGGSAYTMSTLVRDYLTSLVGGGTFEPDLTGLKLSDAVAAARRAHRRLTLMGTVGGVTGTVVLQARSLGGEMDVLVGAGDEPTCRPAQLRLDYQTGEPSAGSDGGTLRLRNVADSWCRLAGPISVTGLIDGRAVTPTVALRLPGGIDLSPHGPPPPDRYDMRRGVLEAEAELSAEYRDDASAPDGSCEPHWVVPSTWRIEIDGRALTLPDGAGRVGTQIGADGLVTCRGAFGALPVRSVAY